MSEPEASAPSQAFLERYTQLRERVERPPAERPGTDTIEAIAAWLVGPARQITTGTEAFDEFCWRNAYLSPPERTSPGTPCMRSMRRP